MQLSKKQIVFQNCFLHFWNVEKILNSSKKKNKKNDPHSWRVSEITDSENHG